MTQGPVSDKMTQATPLVQQLQLELLQQICLSNPSEGYLLRKLVNAIFEQDAENRVVEL